MKVFKNITSLLLAGAIGGSSAGMIPLYASAETTKGEQSYTQFLTNEGSSHSLGFGQTQSTIMKWNLTVSIDTLGMAEKMTGLLQHTTFQNITREMTDQTFIFAKNRYNVMVFTSDSKFQHHFQGIKFHAKLNYYGTNYDVYAFENGTFNTYNQEETKPWAWAYKGWLQSNTTGSNIQFYLPKLGA
ncbi:hypothetical protein CBR56_28500 [Bacillus thuringiensis]|uniref:hypothetical protein n=1 Tax=Bacillus tropicus TaxID=2026188 RepID=UPI000B43B0AD|nr:hypothetical protein [Bacillus tropicus]MED3038494.1 hypothetical protein [Bacillus tropicus]OTX77881.1 hypothetical protein BK728_22665 [Bacillus thuringiensis serovar chanpaisis]PNK22801.1 hypothetical protein CBR56_28500 [Bacillus thuringiensis]